MTLAAFASVDFRAKGDPWADPPYHVDALHGDLADRVVAEFFARTRLSSPAMGQAMIAPPGAGATHLIGALRRRVWDAGANFVRIDASGGGDFWGAAALDLLDSLSRRVKGGPTQASAVLLAAAKTLGSDPAIRAAVEAQAKRRPEKLGAIDTLVEMIAAASSGEDAGRDVVRALALRESREPVIRNTAAGWLQGDSGDESQRRALGFLGPPPRASEIVRRLLGVMSLAGPTLIAVEGIDALFAAGAPSAQQALADGLMELQAVGARTMTLVACAEATWPLLKQRAATTGRIRPLQPLPPVAAFSLAERLIAARLAPAYAKAGFAPPYPTYPFARAAVESAVGMTARELALRCRRHQANCVAAGAIEECRSLADPPPPPAVWPDRDALERWDRQYARRLEEAKPPDDEAGLAALLADACALFSLHLDRSDSLDIEASAGSPGPLSPLHAQLAFTMRDQGGRPARWSFRALTENDAGAFAARLRAASLAAGLGLSGRRLVVLRADPTPEGAADAVARFLEAGGEFIAPDPSDFSAFAALRQLGAPEELATWLRQRKPLFATKLFQLAGLAPPEFLAEAPRAPVGSATPPREEPPPVAPPVESVPEEAPTPAPLLLAPPAPPPPSLAPHAPRSPPPIREIVVGRAVEPGEIVGPAILPAEGLKKRLAVFAGPGRGALLTRIIEEAALSGLPVVALDPNGEFARLGEPWPSRPVDFSDDDARKARAYFERVEVVVWTPGAAEGRPMALNLLPDFAALGRGPDAASARDQAVEMAIATLESHLSGGGPKAIKQRGALADSLRVFARQGGGGFDDFLDLLGDLPETASRHPEAPALARDIAEQLLAASAFDSSLAAGGDPLDLAELFEGAPGRTRVSIVSLAALGSDAARAAFVNRLQMALFGWVREHPAERLYLVDEAQAFSPARENTASRRSALALAREGPKFGLGMVVATAQPQALDPALIAACATHLYGRVEPAPAQAVVKAMMTARGLPDASELKPGEVYFAAEGLSRPVKIRTNPTLSRRVPRI